MKKVLYILPDLYGTGGISRYNLNFINVLADSGFNLKIISKNDKNANFYKNIKVLSFGKFKYKFLKNIFFALTIFWQSLIFKPDITICAHINFSFICALASVFLGKKYFLIVYGIDIWKENSKRKNYGLKKAKKIIAISKFTASKCIEIDNKFKEKIEIIPPFVDKDKFFPKEKSQELIKKYNLKNKKVILTVARLSKTEAYKGYDKVIKAMPKILKEVPEAIYILVGSGEDIKRIKKIVKENNLENKVILTGFVDDKELVDYYNLTDVFVMPSKGEGFGIVFLEALACGVPVIAGNKDGSVDAVLDGELGLLVDPDKTNDIAKAIIGVLKKEIKNKKLIDREYLRKKVIIFYGKERLREKIKNLIKEFE